MDLSEKVSYIRGLAEGMKFDFDTDVGKILHELIAAIQDTAKEIGELKEAYEELNSFVEMVDSDLQELEDEFDLDDDDNDDDDDDDDGFGLVEEDFDEDFDEDDEDDDDTELFLGCICPACKGIFCVESEDSPKHVCPHCHKSVEGIPMNGENVPVAMPSEEE